MAMEEYLNEDEIKTGLYKVFLISAKEGFLDVCEELSSNIDFCPRPELYLEALTLAAENGHLEILKFLKRFLDNFGPSEKYDETLVRAFMLSAKNEHLEVSKWMLEQDFNSSMDLHVSALVYLSADVWRSKK